MSMSDLNFSLMDQFEAMTNCQKLYEVCAQTEL